MTRRISCWLSALASLGIATSLPAQAPTRVDVVSRTGNSANQQVANTISEHLRQSGNLRNYNVTVSFQNGIADLTGHVADQAQHEETLRIVQGVPGVERVRDRLTVQSPMPYQYPAMLYRAQAVGPAPSPLPPAAPAAPAAPAMAPRGGAEPVPVFQAAPPSPYNLSDVRMPPYAWPSYAPYNNYSRVGYPQLYPYNSWPFIGPCYPFPKIPLGWRSVKLEWQDGYWWYSKHSNSHDWWRLRYW